MKTIKSLWLLTAILSVLFFSCRKADITPNDLAVASCSSPGGGGGGGGSDEGGGGGDNGGGGGHDGHDGGNGGDDNGGGGGEIQTDRQRFRPAFRRIAIRYGPTCTLNCCHARNLSRRLINRL